MFIGEEDIPKDDLKKLINNAFKSFKDENEPISIAKLKNGLNIAELFHGPTLAFKDLALGVVGQLYEYFLEKAEKHMTVLIPKGRCTKIQELQMTTVLDENVHCFGVDGSS